MINKYHKVWLDKCVLKTGLVIIASSFIISCKVYKPAIYFKDITKDTIITGFIKPELELRIQTDDMLNIAVSSLSPAEDILFNSTLSSSKDGPASGYQVGPDGSIYLHKLGKLTVVGMTRKELKNQLEKELLPYLKDPVVTVNFSNHTVTFLGESGSQVLSMPEEKISLIDVMAKSAGITPNTRLNKVLIIRETKGAKQFKHINLEDPSIFTSPWYYLQPNDIVVVKPNEQKFEDEQKRLNRQQIIGTALSAVTFVFFILDRIFRK